MMTTAPAPDQTRTSRRMGRPIAAPPPESTIAAAVALASFVSGVARADIVAGSRGGAPVAGARQLAVYLAHVALGHDLTLLSAAFGRDRATLRHALRRIEAERDDPHFDALLSSLEAVLLPLRADASRGGRA